MKKFNLGLFAILMAIALGLTTDKPTGANSPRLSTCSLDSLYAPSTLPLRAAPRLIADDSMRNQGLVESYNWSGYAVPTTTAGSVTYAAGSWTVPAVTGSAGQYSAIWVGLDGFDDGTVEQLGTMQYLTSVRSGRSTTTQAQYCAWVEMYPAAMVELTGTVQPGDSITA